MPKTPFENLDEESKILKVTVPFWVPVTKNPNEENYDQIVKRHEKFLTLSEPIQNKLSSLETSAKIQEIGKVFGLELLRLAEISRAIRNYYFGEVKPENFAAIFAKEMNIDADKAGKIAKVVIEKIIHDKSQEIAYQDRLEKITLPEALKKYPEIMEQSVTSEKISLRGFSEPARPSVKNWLADYAFNLGHGTHSAIERGNFIFHGVNGKNLSNPDRQKLAYLLKAYDENVPVTVNKDMKQMIFPVISEARPASPLPKPAMPLPQKTVPFSQATAAQKPTTASSQAQTTAPMQKPATAAPKPTTAFSSRAEQLGKNLSTFNSSEPKKQTASDASIKFSSPQKLPYEKAQDNQIAKPQTESLSDLLRKKDGGAPPKNVINLKSQT